jgi:transcriptional regulator with XRE-family HTH domain
MARKKRPPAPIGDTIKATMKARGLTACAIGKTSGVSATIIGRWFNGERSPRLDTIERIVAALDLVLMEKSYKSDRGEREA